MLLLVLRAGGSGRAAAGRRVKVGQGQAAGGRRVISVEVKY